MVMNKFKPSPKMNKVETHSKICKKLNDLYINKDSDYGNSFGKLREEQPNAILVRIYDKYNRLNVLLKGADQKVKGESIEDTLTDLANYCILELIEREMDKWK